MTNSTTPESLAAATGAEMPDINALIDAKVRETVLARLQSTIEHSAATRFKEQYEKEIDNKINAAYRETVSSSVYRQKFMHVERTTENLIFNSRWTLALPYGFLFIVLFALMARMGMELWQFAIEFFDVKNGNWAKSTPILIQALKIVDIVLIINLIFMIIIVGYTHFISQIFPNRMEDWPGWTKTMSYSGLKVQIMGSMIAISSIMLLEQLLAIQKDDGRLTAAIKALAQSPAVPDGLPPAIEGALSAGLIPTQPERIWLSIAIQAAFVLSALVLAIINKLKTKSPALDDH